MEQKIKIRISERTYNLKSADSAQEEMMRKAADEINKMFGTNISVDYRQNTAPITLDGVTTTTENYEEEVDREVQKGGVFGG